MFPATDTGDNGAYVPVLTLHHNVGSVAPVATPVPKSVTVAVIVTVCSSTHAAVKLDTDETVIIGV